MDYPGPHYPFVPEHGVHLSCPTPAHYPPVAPPPQHLESYFTGQPPCDFADLGHHMSMIDDYEDGAETSSRPRLTKDQVDVLESQFQAQPKPNSNVKRQLAVQTKLSLARVAVRLDIHSPPSRLTVAELVSKPSSQGETAKETRGIRDEESNGRGRGVEERRQSTVDICSSPSP